MKTFIKLLLIFAPGVFYSQNATLKTLNDLTYVAETKATSVDSFLISKGFVNSDVSGLVFIYTKKNERFILQTKPREFVYAFDDKVVYLKISTQVSELCKLISTSDSVSYNKKIYLATTFEDTSFRISFWTDYNTALKTTSYFIRINNVNDSKSVVLSNKESIDTVPSKNAPQKTLIRDGAFANKQPFRVKDKDTLGTEKSVTTDLTQEICIKKTRITGGIGVYKYIRIPTATGMSDLSERLAAYNLGAEISKDTRMKRTGNYYTNTAIDVNLTTFPGMQRYYPDGVTSTFQTIYLTKSFLTVGLISEIRYKKESFLMCFDPGINWTSGKIEDVGRKSLITGTIQMGEYIQHNFKSKKENTDFAFLRLGFEQFFSLKGGYIGQFALTLGY